MSLNLFSKKKKWCFWFFCVCNFPKFLRRSPRKIINSSQSVFHENHVTSRVTRSRRKVQTIILPSFDSNEKLLYSIILFIVHQSNQKEENRIKQKILGVLQTHEIFPLKTQKCLQRNEFFKGKINFVCNGMKKFQKYD